MSDAIQERIDAFLAGDVPAPRDLLPTARADPFLPLYIGWISVLGIRTDESFVRWDEDQPAIIRPLTDAFWQRMAICEGARKYPELRALLPVRPDTALTCPSCRGTAAVDERRFVCTCGGTGWIIRGEARDELNPG